MKVCILTANLGNFDTPVDPVEQNIPTDFHRFTDDDFPSITGLTPRLQYRIPKTHGWQMKPGDIYLWLDGTFTLAKENSLEWFINKLGDADMVLFKHPWRNTIKEEVEHIEEHLKLNKPYITSRYKNGLHKEQLEHIYKECPDYIDDTLFTSTVFIYRSTPKVQEMMKEWLYTSVRYFTCDQIVLPYLVKKYKLNVSIINENQYKFEHLEIASRHK
jgi:hypothetical protein